VALPLPMLPQVIPPLEGLRAARALVRPPAQMHAVVVVLQTILVREPHGAARPGAGVRLRRTDPTGPLALLWWWCRRGRLLLLLLLLRRRSLLLLRRRLLCWGRARSRSGLDGGEEEVAVHHVGEVGEEDELEEVGHLAVVVVAAAAVLVVVVRLQGSSVVLMSLSKPSLKQRALSACNIWNGEFCSSQKSRRR